MSDDNGKQAVRKSFPLFAPVAFRCSTNSQCLGGDRIGRLTEINDYFVIIGDITTHCKVSFLSR